MRKLKMSVKAFLTVLWLANSVGHAGAIDLSFRPNASELLRLPPYCEVKFNKPRTSPEWKAWYGQIGENYIDIHHYCVALNYVNRYWGARDKQDKGFYLQSALNNFDYMAKAEKPGFPFGAELYSNRGEVYKLMRKSGEAVKDFNRALSIDPRFIKPYLQLADLNVAGKSPARALEIVTEGLRHVPDSTALQRRYLELGGKKPFPEPIAAKAAEPVSAQASVPTPAAGAAIEPVPTPAPVVSPELDAAAPSNSALPIGTKKNPYCRFCPPE